VIVYVALTLVVLAIVAAIEFVCRLIVRIHLGRAPTTLASAHVVDALRRRERNSR
jgi:threonine/homoserine efflux transporter RhtA